MILLIDGRNPAHHFQVLHILGGVGFLSSTVLLTSYVLIDHDPTPSGSCATLMYLDLGDFLHRMLVWNLRAPQHIP